MVGQNTLKKVSVIIPCYNHGKYVEESVLSVINQTYSNIEIVCVNDGSSDDSSQILTKLADKYKNVKLFDEKENRGVVYCRNMAIQASTGEYILPLDADDKIAPTFVEKAVKILEENVNVGVVCCNVRLMGKKNKKWKLAEPTLENMLRANQVVNCAMYRRTDFDKIGGYKANMETGYEDWDLWLSFMEQGLTFYRLEEELLLYRLHNDGSRTKSTKGKMSEIYSAIINNHVDLFLSNEKFVESIFKCSPTKLNKYKNLCKILFGGLLVQAILIVVLSLVG